MIIYQILQCYETTSGQCITLTKSSLVFSSNMLREIWQDIVRVLHIDKMDAPDKFLGLPLEIPRTKRETFSSIVDRIATKTAGWKEQLLSKGGKEVLIKAVAVAIPVYVMSSFKLPAFFWKSITSLISNF
ncbi:hypothetical protein P3X46_019854 [Hevea brasiliensis]|uniref:Uncharacterized protein n=1 Tax=Hevea brasiliensis TaxID=3981 RepID=A0ABQ9LK07_HEVBR|nr:hypothetical protein P3X46_019854 [Hevea brasiliensis]